MSSAVESLMFVAELSSSKLKVLVQRLDSAEPRKVSGLIAGIEKESTVLSQAIQKLSGHLDSIREQEDVECGPKSPPDDDKSLLIVAKTLRAIASGAMTKCLGCGGFVDNGGDHGRFEFEAVPNNGALARAHRANGA